MPKVDFEYYSAEESPLKENPWIKPEEETQEIEPIVTDQEPAATPLNFDTAYKVMQSLALAGLFFCGVQGSNRVQHKPNPYEERAPIGGIQYLPVSREEKIQEFYKLLGPSTFDTELLRSDANGMRYNRSFIKDAGVAYDVWVDNDVMPDNMDSQVIVDTTNIVTTFSKNIDPSVKEVLSGANVIVSLYSTKDSVHGANVALYADNNALTLDYRAGTYKPISALEIKWHVAYAYVCAVKIYSDLNGIDSDQAEVLMTALNFAKSGGDYQMYFDLLTQKGFKVLSPEDYHSLVYSMVDKSQKP